MMKQVVSDDIEKRIFEVKQALAQQLAQLKGKWIIIDLKNKDIFFASSSLQEAKSLLIKHRRGKELYLEHVGGPTFVGGPIANPAHL